MGIRLSERALRLLDPVQSLLDEACGASSSDDIVVDVGESEGFYRVEPKRIVLDVSLEGPGMHHPREPTTALQPVDRWRRALSSVVEGVALLELSNEVAAPVSMTWPWLAAAIDRADQQIPALGVADADLAAALASGTAVGRGGLAVARAWRAAGHDPWERARRVIAGESIGIDEWLALGQWLLGREPVARLGTAVSRVAPVDIPFELPPWSWARVAVPAHPRGGEVGVEGPGGALSSYAVADVVFETLTGALDGTVRFVPRSGGPVGTWDVASARGFGQTYGFRGLQFCFRSSGVFEVVLADAFMGPLEALELADQMGTSGTSRGRWSVAGQQELRFQNVVNQGLSMHGRGGAGYAMPADNAGIGVGLRALEEGVWGWEIDGGTLWLRGALGGGGFEVRLQRSR